MNRSNHLIPTLAPIGTIFVLAGCVSSTSDPSLPAWSPRPNPVLDGWYADPEAVVLGGQVWIYPTTSAKYDDQSYLDAFSSSDLSQWTKHPRVLDIQDVTWARRALWAPALLPHRGRFYLFFAANDIQSDAEVGGIGVAVADQPQGPFRDHLGKPLIDRFHNGAQPIDQFVFRDRDDTLYMVYGGWRHCNIVRLSDDLTRLVPHDDGSIFKETTPEGYVEGPFMFERGGRYYFMWSEGGWTGPDYSVAYAIADAPTGPFTRRGKILQQDAAIATGAGHHSVIARSGTPAASGSTNADEYWIVYHRRPLGRTGANDRVVCIDRLEFAPDGSILPIRMTPDGQR